MYGHPLSLVRQWWARFCYIICGVFIINGKDVIGLYRQTRPTGNCWRSKEELRSDMLLRTPSHGRAKVGRPSKTYIQQLCTNTENSLKDFLGAMGNRERERERVREIHAGR